MFRRLRFNQCICEQSAQSMYYLAVASCQCNHSNCYEKEKMIWCSQCHARHGLHTERFAASLLPICSSYLTDLHSTDADVRKRGEVDLISCPKRFIMPTSFSELHEHPNQILEMLLSVHDNFYLQRDQCACFCLVKKAELFLDLFDLISAAPRRGRRALISVQVVDPLLLQPVTLLIKCYFIGASVTHVDSFFVLLMHASCL